jgi:tRNA nucleotidyltransferase (CCA-adding enzyme)
MAKTTFDKVTQTILKKYKTSKKEHDQILKKIESFLHDLRAALEREKIDAYVMLGGSAAKGTFLRHDFDCDVFVRFIYDEYKEKDVSQLLEKALKHMKGTTYERVHGSRDYFIGTWKELQYEIIPVLYINDKRMAKNITDMSPLHVEWLNQHLTEEIRDQIILTKLFFKAQKVYGAESYMNGFSGHIVDLLTIYYGSFKELLENIVKWQEKELINMTSHPININDFNPDKIQSAIIVVDPVEPERNAAAAVGFEQFYHIQNQATTFLENPNENFFKRTSISIKELQAMKKEAEKKQQAMIIVKALPTHGKLDTIGTKIFKTHEFIQEELKRNNFTVEKAGWEWEEDQDKEAILWYMTKEKKLSATQEHAGPPLKRKEDVAAFQKKHKKFFFKENKIYTTIKRKYTTAEALIKERIKDKRIKEKARKWSLMKV